jgi:putative membrane protein
MKQSVIFKSSNYSLSLWIVIGVYAVWSFGLQQALAPVLEPFTRNLLEQGLLTAFFLIHAFGYFKPREVLAFALICFVVSNLLENTSVLYGFPFGYFYHSTATGPRLFNIPWLATPTYMAMGYTSWMVTQVLLERFRPVHWPKSFISTALVASFVFSMWDFCNDAVFHTINKAFFYRFPGPWFGVPVSNFLGWLLTTFIFFGLFSFYLSKRKETGLSFRPAPAKTYWLQAVLVYLINAGASMYRNANGKSFPVTLSNGDIWQSEVIYTAMTLTTMFTMVFISIFAIIQLYKKQVI